MVGNRNEDKGIALIATLVAMLVLGAIVSGVLLIALHERAVGAGSAPRLQSFLAAESGLNRVSETWSARRFLAVAPGTSQTFADWLPDSSGWFRTTVRRIFDTYIIAAEGFSRDSAFRQHLGMLAGASTLAVPVPGALTASGTVAVGGTTTISGIGCWPDSGAAGVVLPDSTFLLGSPMLFGVPPLLEDSVIAASVTSEIWWTQTDTAVIRAADYLLDSMTPIPGAFQLPWDTCRAPDQSWRTDPVTCRAEAPVVVITGDANIAGQTGRGLLVVLGDLRVSGDLEFTGLIYVGGSVTTVPDSTIRVRVEGALLVVDASQVGSSLFGNWTVAFSACAVRELLDSSAIIRATPIRSWAHLY